MPDTHIHSVSVNFLKLHLNNINISGRKMCIHICVHVHTLTLLPISFFFFCAIFHGSISTLSFLLLPWHTLMNDLSVFCIGEPTHYFRFLFSTAVWESSIVRAGMSDETCHYIVTFSLMKAIGITWRYIRIRLLFWYIIDAPYFVLLILDKPFMCKTGLEKRWWSTH